MLQSRLNFPLVTNQVEFSVLHPEPLFDGTFDHAQRNRYTPMIWSPLAGGRLFAEVKDARVARVVNEMKMVALEIGSNVGIDQIAFAWILQVPCKPCVIVGTNNIDRIQRLVDSVPITLSKPQWFRILEATQGCEVP